MNDTYNQAREYVELFDTGVYGRLYIHAGNPAQGWAFRVCVVPEDFVGDYLSSDAVEVYGLIGTEEYGWKHDGPWQDDFGQLVIDRRAKLRLAQSEKLAKERAEKLAKESRIKTLLADYSEVVQ